jgi:ABC-2 type transport system permease protein
MTRLGALLSVGFKSQFPLALLWREIRFNQKSRKRILAITFLVAAALAPTLYAYFLIIHQVYLILQPAGQASAMIVLGVISGQIVVFIFGLFYLISAFYFTNDLEVLIPLPVRPNQVLLSKFVVVLLNEYMTILPIILPVLVGYGVLSRAPADFWILLVPVCLLLPVIPLALSALLSVGLMRVVNLSRRKDALIIVGSLLIIVLSAFIQTRPGGGGQDMDALIQTIAGKDGLLGLLGRKFPPSVWASRSLSQGFTGIGALHFLLFVGVSILLFAGLVILSEKLFYQGAIGLGEISAKRRRISRAEIERKVSTGRHPVRAIFWREVKLMNRTPIFLLNGLLVVVIVPVIFMAGVMSPGARNPLFSVFKIAGAANPETMIWVLAAFFLVCGCLNGTASSAFSREGRQFWISKVLPVPWRQQVAAKFFHSYLISLLGIVVAAAAAALFMGAPTRVLLGAVLLAVAASAALTVIGLSIDLARPLLDWTNPQKAIKQNFNVFLALAVDLGSVTLCGFLASLLRSKGISGATVTVMLFAIALLAAWVGWRNLLAFADRKYPAIEA